MGVAPGLEDIVHDYVINALKSAGLSTTVRRNARVIRNPDSVSGMWEIDIYLPKLGLGFEVQDFWTHSRTSDEEWFQYGKKRGPTYHRLKRERASAMGVNVVELWEDEIKNGGYKSVIDNAVKQAMSDNTQVGTPE